MLKKVLQNPRLKVVGNCRGKLGESSQRPYGLSKMPQNANRVKNGRHLHCRWRRIWNKMLHLSRNVEMHRKWSKMCPREWKSKLSEMVTGNADGDRISHKISLKAFYEVRRDIVNFPRGSCDHFRQLWFSLSRAHFWSFSMHLDISAQMEHFASDAPPPAMQMATVYHPICVLRHFRKSVGTLRTCRHLRVTISDNF